MHAKLVLNFATRQRFFQRAQSNHTESCYPQKNRIYEGTYRERGDWYFQSDVNFRAFWCNTFSLLFPHNIWSMDLLIVFNLTNINQTCCDDKWLGIILVHCSISILLYTFGVTQTFDFINSANFCIQNPVYGIFEKKLPIVIQFLWFWKILFSPSSGFSSW